MEERASEEKMRHESPSAFQTGGEGGLDEAGVSEDGENGGIRRSLGGEHKRLVSLHSCS